MEASARSAAWQVFSQKRRVCRRAKTNEKVNEKKASENNTKIKKKEKFDALVGTGS